MKKERFNDLLSTDYKSIDYKAIIFDYLLYWPLIVLCLGLFLIGAHVYLRYQAPIFTVSSTMLVKQGDKSKPTSSSQLAAMQDLGMLSMANNFDNEIEIIQSYTLIKKVVTDLNLYISYEKEASFGYNQPLYNNLPYQVWMSSQDAENLPCPLQIELEAVANRKVSAAVKYFVGDKETVLKKDFCKFPAVFATPLGAVTINASKDSLLIARAVGSRVISKIISPSGMAGSFKSRLHAEPTSEYTSIIRLTISDSCIPRAVDFLTALVETYNDEANRDKNQVAIKTAEFIDGRIQVINEELGVTETELADYKQRAGLTDLRSDANLALQGTSEYEQKRADNTSQLRLIGFLKEYIENPINKNEVIPVEVGLSDRGLTSIISQYNELIIERKRLLRTSKVVSPAVVNLDVSIAATLHAVLSTVESVRRSLYITRDLLDVEAGKYRTKISNAPKQERDLRDISRQQEIKSNLYLMLLQKREENAITLAAKANNGRVVEEPRISGFVYPNKRNTYMISFVLGILLPIIGIFIARLLRIKIEGRADVEKLTDIAIVGDIPQIQLKGESMIVIEENKNGLFEEIYRNLRTNIQFMLEEEQKVILITSTSSSEGKSFNAVNLAASFAFMGKKTVIVGLDIRKPSLNHIFGLNKHECGISEFLSSSNRIDLLSCCQQLEMSPNLYVLPTGIIPPNPTELVARNSLEKAIRILKDKFDYIILDTAPIGMVTDTRLISRVADLCVYVCRADHTRKSDLELVNEMVNDEKLPPFCILINGIDMNKRKNGYYYGYGKYGKYGKYGYQYKYGYGYSK